MEYSIAIMAPNFTLGRLGITHTVAICSTQLYLRILDEEAALVRLSPEPGEILTFRGPGPDIQILKNLGD